MKLEDRVNYDLICTVKHEIKGQSSFLFAFLGKPMNAVCFI